MLNLERHRQQWLSTVVIEWIILQMENNALRELMLKKHMWTREHIGQTLKDRTHKDTWPHQEMRSVTLLLDDGQTSPPSSSLVKLQVSMQSNTKDLTVEESILYVWSTMMSIIPMDTTFLGKRLNKSMLISSRLTPSQMESTDPQGWKGHGKYFSLAPKRYSKNHPQQIRSGERTKP